jgi:hypothetical protein
LTNAQQIRLSNAIWTRALAQQMRAEVRSSKRKEFALLMRLPIGQSFTTITGTSDSIL